MNSLWEFYKFPRGFENAWPPLNEASLRFYGFFPLEKPNIGVTMPGHGMRYTLRRVGYMQTRLLVDIYTYIYSLTSLFACIQANIFCIQACIQAC